MSASFANTGFTRGLMAAILSLTLLTRILVPAGFMPAAQGSPAVMLCTAEGIILGWIDADGTVHTQEKKQKSMPDSPCMFSGLSVAVDGFAHAIPSIAIRAAATVALGANAPVAVGRGLAAPPPPPTGPPLQS